MQHSCISSFFFFAKFLIFVIKCYLRCLDWWQSLSWGFYCLIAQSILAVYYLSHQLPKPCHVHFLKTGMDQRLKWEASSCLNQLDWECSWASQLTRFITIGASLTMHLCVQCLAGEVSFLLCLVHQLNKTFMNDNSPQRKWRKKKIKVDNGKKTATKIVSLYIWVWILFKSWTLLILMLDCCVHIFFSSFDWYA